MYSNRIKTAYISEITYMEQNEFCVLSSNPYMYV